ncbi:hypothetical protein [Smaragdicoccus niigatensis]|uniref:hypothetical protein n=1 Tax=Smaragdicoccus niigatensis TaxID=359359 RepID=UPI000374566B|nr:hypothetical protein [Smaragdicoccus niigatensis]
MTLALNEMAMLRDALKPPAGMQLDAAVGTTFTLDLTALLAIPVAATLDQEPNDDRAEILETIRRYSDSTVLFCQAGAISVPARYREALTFVEQTVVEVKKPKNGIFHPKMWALRFTNHGSVHHRVLVLSRNLTFDRAWDIIIRIDEDDDGVSTFDSSDLVEFLQSLEPQAARLMTTKQKELVRSLTTSITDAKLAIPRPFESGRFLSLPGRGRDRPFRGGSDNALAISPFLSASSASRFFKDAKRSAVVSRTAALNASASGLTGVRRTLRLRDDFFDIQRDLETGLDDPVEGEDERPAMRGLHAKVLVKDRGSRSTSWFGSTNLTQGAFATNVEFLVELTGPTAWVGCNALLSPKPRQDNLSWLVEAHDLEPSDDEDSEVTEFEGQLQDLASRSFTISLAPSVDDQWDATLRVTPWDSRASALRVSLLSLPNDARVLDKEGGATWEYVPVRHLTPFVLIELTSPRQSQRTVVRADLIGGPEGRRNLVLANAIASREDFYAYLYALLGVESGLGASASTESMFLGWASGAGADRILEDLLTTVSREPSRLDSLDQTIQQLKGKVDVVPAEFHEVWDAINEVRKSAQR